MPARSGKQTAFMAGWLRGFADGEGCVNGHTQGTRSIVITNTELVLLETAQMYLAALGIRSRIGLRNAPLKAHWLQAWSLAVFGYQNLRRWHDLIGFASALKQERLTRVLARYKKGRLPQQEIVDAYCKGDSTLALAKRYGVTHGAIEYMLKKRGIRARDYSQAAILQWRRRKAG